MKSYSLSGDSPDLILMSLPSYDAVLGRLMYSRGIDTEEKAEAFLNPNFDKHIHNPFLLKGMDVAVKRLRESVINKEMICVWSDYDADGIPGAVLMSDFLKKIGAVFFIYIPDRHHEGFGLNSEGVGECKEKGAKLIITVDCGIADIDEIAHAKKLGIDVIVTDHHMPVQLLSDETYMGEPKYSLPDAVAIIDHKQEGCLYPDKNLCGSAVAWKLVCAYLSSYRQEHEIPVGWEKWLLDMVGIATLSDMVSLTGENRALATYGLYVLRKSPRPGLQSLLGIAGVSQKNISEDDVGFSITPRINAASRMGVPRDAFELLSSDDEVTAIPLAKKLDKINSARKTTVTQLSKDARKHLINDRFTDKSVIVTGDPTWRPSLLGLVANTFAEEFGKPVFLWGRDGDGIIKGSCRSGGGKSVLSIMRGAPDKTFIAYGGHMASGGFEVEQGAINLLPDILHESGKSVDVEGNNGGLIVDVELSINDITWALFDKLLKLSPYGVGNKKPIFAFPGVIPSNVSLFGKEKNHIKIEFPHKELRNISAISFHKTPESFTVKPEAGKPMTLIANIELNSFGYKRELRLRIIDILQ